MPFSRGGLTKKAIVASWAKTLGIAGKDPTGEKVKQNTDKLVSARKAANDQRHDTGFGDIEQDGQIITSI